ncbi:MAG: HAMP domain-containing sensor histidine kinase [Candidatus Absconditabacteria bacterium]|nr:HAMP domain-containing sensor histidine kinase [Candidatus Absconditabacteria bacterium]
MHITNQEQLKRQKRKLSLIFTLILFAVVTGLQIIFLIGRYLDYTNREIQNLENEIFPKHTLQQNMMSESMIGTIPSMPMFGKEGRGRRLKGGNIISYNPQKNLIISSSLGDEEFTRELLQELLKKEETKGTIFYNKNKFLFLKDTTNSGIQSFFLVPIHMQISDVIRDSILFILFFGFLSVLFYRVIYRFVGKLFLPIEENIQDMEQFIFNAGHELKTPLSVTKSHLQLALAKKQYKKSIDESIKEIDKMNDLLEALINLSVIHQEAEKENIDIAQEVDYLVVQYESKAKKKKIKISIKKDKSFDITANKGHINMLISNLISNAIKYNKNGGKIEISINSGEMYVKDTGIGISPKDVEKIFDRFYQVGGVRNQEGFGIGLALVKKIVDMYGWKIDVFSQENIGTTIRIRFN